MFKQLILTVTAAIILLSANAQDKEIAKVDALITKARAEQDKIKKTELYNKAAEIINTAKLGKEQNAKLGDAYVEEGDVVKASQFYMRCDAADKKAGYVKIGDKLIEIAPEDPKSEPKNMKKAIDYYTKAGQTKEGYEAVGNAYYNRGKEFYMKAAEYYAQGGVNTKLEKVAGDYIAAGEKDNAANVYLKLNTTEGFKKAGDLFFAAGKFNDAFDAYDKGKVGEGLQKYGDKLYADGLTSEGDAQYTKASEIFVEKNNKDGLSSLAASAEKRGNFAMAASFYEKAGETDKAGYAKAYEALYMLEFDAAKLALEGINDFETAKAITANAKFLNPLKDVAFTFDEIKKDQPVVSIVENTDSGKKEPNPADVSNFNEYYKGLAGSIYDNVNILSLNVPKITNARLKEIMMKKFMMYGAVKNILDNNFGKKIQKTQVTYKEVIM
jgi:tetratricopeptide (TPR) repeat protein